MGSALSRCTSKDSGRATAGLSEIGQKVLDRQPNWLVPPTRWRSQACPHQPVRYRTPTPYPKDGRRPVDEPRKTITVHVPEKALVVEAPTVTHIEVVAQHRREAPAQPPKRISHPQKPQAALSITWDASPRLNRFERVA